MRYKINDYAPSNVRQYTFSVGKKDLEILYGLTLTTSAGLPHIKEMYDIRHRLTSMLKAFKKALDEADKLGDDGERRKEFIKNHDPAT